MRKIVSLLLTCISVYALATSTPRHTLTNWTSYSANCIIAQGDTLWIGNEYEIEKRLKDGTVKNYYSNYDNVSNMLLDNKNHLWIACKTGLFVYDGASLEEIIIPSDETMLQDNVTKLSIDANQNVWAITPQKAVRIGEKDTLVYDKTKFDDDVFLSAFGRNDTVWLGTSNGIIQISTKDTVRIGNVAQYGISVSDIVSFDKNSLLVLIGGSLKLLQNNTLSNFQTMETKLIAQNTSQLLVATEKEVYSIANNTLTALHFKSSEVIQHISLEKDTIWLGTYSYIYKYSNNSWQQLPRLGTTAIHYIKADTQNNVWFEQDNVLIKRSPNNKLTFYHIPESNDTIEFNAIAISKKNEIWIATHGAGLYKFANNVWTNYKKDENNIATSIPTNYVHDILLDKKDSIWIATYYGVATRNGTWKTYTDADGLIGTSNYDLAIDTAGNIVATAYNYDNDYGWQYTGVSKFQNNTWSKLLTCNDTLHIRQVRYDKQNRLWVSDTAGVFMYDGKWHNLSAQVENKSCYQIFSSSSGEILVVGGNGLYRYVNNRLVEFLTENTLKYTNIITQIDEDSLHNIWIGSESGLIKVNQPTANISFKEACVGKAVTLEGSSNAPNATYNWDTNNDGLIDQTGKTITYTCKSKDDVITVWVATDFDTCDVKKTIVIHKPVIAQIGVVTVSDDNSSVLIAWNREENKRIAQYNVYKSTESGFKLLGSQRFDTVSIMRDPNSDVAHTQYTYKLTTTDDCGATSPLDSSIAHTTVHVSNIVSNGKCDLLWNKYEGAEVKGYSVYETTNGTDLRLIETLPFQNTSATKNPVKEGVHYRIGVNLKYETDPNVLKSDTGPFSQSMSNMSEASLVDVLAMQNISLVAFPRVVTSEITVLLSAPQAIMLEYEILSLNGQTLYHSAKQLTSSLDEHIATTNLPAGLYQLRVSINDVVKLFEFVKQ